MPEQKKSILVIKNRAIGDTVLLTGALRVLRRHRPDYRIDVLVKSPADKLLQGLSYVDEVMPLREPHSKLMRTAYWMREIGWLRKTHYDVVLNFHSSVRLAMAARFLRADRKVANHHKLKGRNWFSDVTVPGRGKVKAAIDRDLDVLRAIGIDVPLEDAMPEIQVTQAERENALGMIARLQSKTASYKGPRIFLGIGASRDTKRWPERHFAELVRRFAHDLDATFVLATLPEDQAWMKKFYQALGPIDSGRIQHFQALPLRQVASLISQCKGYIGNDSGLKHVAVALGLGSFTFFGPESPEEWHPYSTDRHPYAYVEGLACRTETGKHWCPISVCTRHGHKCLEAISVDEVFSRALPVFQGTKEVKL